MLVWILSLRVSDPLPQLHLLTLSHWSSEDDQDVWLGGPNQGASGGEEGGRGHFDLEEAIDDIVGGPAVVTDIRANIIINTFLPVLTMTVTFAFYTLVQKQELTASKGRLALLAHLMSVFTSMTVFELVKQQMGMVRPHIRLQLTTVLLPGTLAIVVCAYPRLIVA